MPRIKNQPVVKLKGMSGSEFMGKLNGLRKHEKADGSYSTDINLSKDLMINLDTKLFTGMVEPEASAADDAAKRTSVPATTPVNLYTMCNLDPELLQAAGVPANVIKPLYSGTSQYEGNTVNAVTYLEDGKALPATPVGMDVVYDPSANQSNVLDNYTVTPHVDFGALGNASTKEQNDIRISRGKTALPKGKEGRLNVTATYPVTKDGLGGMNVERLQQNVAKCSAADYIMNASPKAPNDRLPSVADIEAVSKLYNDTFADFVKDITKKGCDGVDSIKSPGEKAKDKNGNVLSCKSLSALGIKPVTVNGASVLVVTGDESGKADRKEGLGKMNEVFNARWKQVINERVPDPAGGVDEKGQPNMVRKYSDNIVRLGNAMELNSHAVTVRNPMDRDKKTGLVLVQPSLDYNMTPLANALGKSVAVATHQLDAKDPTRQPYADAIIKNAQELSTAFDKTAPGVERTAEQKAVDQKAAIDANMKQFKDICKAANLDADKMLAEPAKGQKEDEQQFE